MKRKSGDERSFNKQQQNRTRTVTITKQTTVTNKQTSKKRAVHAVQKIRSDSTVHSP